MSLRSPIPVADAHGHIGGHPDFPAYRCDAASMLAVMDQLNIELLSITATRACFHDAPRGNAEVDAWLQRHPHRFRGYITVNPHVPGEALRELERWSHFHRPPLIKLHPAAQNYPVHGAGYQPVWDYANQTGAVVLVHTWDSDPRCGPLLFPPLGRAYPRARILLGHSGVTWQGYEQAQEAAAAAPNLLLEICGSQHHRLMLEQCVHRLGPERILYGSDLPYLEASMTLAHVLTARIPDAAKERILRHNFLQLLAES